MTRKRTKRRGKDSRAFGSRFREEAGLRPARRKASGFWLPETESYSVSWVDLVVIPLIAILSVPPLLWFGHHPWTVIGYDAPATSSPAQSSFPVGALTAALAFRTTMAVMVPFSRP
jgi:hypothetical protein